MSVATVAGILLAAAGLLCWFVPEKWWRGWFRAGSRWRNQTSTGALLLFSGMMAGGVGLFSLNAVDFLNGVRSKSWVETKAVVTGTRVVEVMQPRSTNPAYRPQVDYEYRWNGRGFRGGRLGFGSTASTDGKHVRDLLDRDFPAGREIRVKVNPDKPSQSVIRTGADAMHWVYAGVSLVFVGVGANGLRMLAKDWEGDGKTVTSRRRGGGGP